MRRFRRFTAAVTALLMIHLAIVSGVMTCPMNDGAAGVVAVAMSHEGGDTRHMTHAVPSHGDASAGTHEQRSAPDAPADQHSDNGPQCTVSCPSSGCSSAGHCGSTSMRRASGESTSLFADAAGLTPQQLGAPRAVNSAPEPPPPRA